MSAAHTPGLWKAVDENVAKEIDCFEVASVSHMRVILKGGGWPVKTGKPEDDARLIAAAPELLEALLWVKSQGWANYAHRFPNQNDDFCDAVDRINAAIAKATGAAA